MVEGVKTVDRSQLPTHKSCRFGKWYESEGKRLCGNLPAFRNIEGPHDSIHSLEKEIVATAKSGDREAASAKLSDLNAISERIAGLIDDLEREAENMRGQQRRRT